MLVLMLLSGCVNPLTSRYNNIASYKSVLFNRTLELVTSELTEFTLLACVNIPLSQTTKFVIKEFVQLCVGETVCGVPSKRISLNLRR